MTNEQTNTTAAADASSFVLTDERKPFHIGAVLTILTDKLVAPGLMEDVYAILNHMTGESLYTHQLPRVSRECAPYLAAAFPDLSSDAMKAEVAYVCEKIALAQKLGASGVSDLLAGWLRDLADDLGYSEVEVGQLPEGVHKWRDPLAELVAMRGGDASSVHVVPVTEPRIAPPSVAPTETAETEQAQQQSGQRGEAGDDRG